MSCEKSNPNRGSTLLLVIIVFALLLVFGMAAITLSSNAHKNAVTDYQTQQAYFTARSAVLAAVDYVKNDSDPKALLEKLAALGTSDKTVDAQLGEYDLTVTKLDDTHYQIASLANADGVERAFYTILELNAASPFEGLATVPGEKANVFFTNQGRYVGDVYVTKRSDNQPIQIQFVKLYGDVFFESDVRFLDGQTYFYEYTMNGDTQGGNIYVGGNATFNGQIEVQNNLYVWGNATFNPTGASKIGGNNYVNGSVSGSNKNGIGGKGVKKIPDGIEFPQKDYAAIPPATDAVFNPPSGAAVPSSYPPLSGSKIVGNGTVSPGFFSSDKRYTVDTSAGDIYIVFESGNYTIRGFTVEGDNQAYIYLKNNVNIKVDGLGGVQGVFGDATAVDSSFFGDVNSWTFDESKINHAPRMTIISSSSNARIEFNDRNLLSAYVYMPYGTIYSQAGYFCGSLIAQDISNDQCIMAYIPPDPSSTPPGGGGGGSGGITVVGNYSGKPKSGAS